MEMGTRMAMNMAIGNTMGVLIRMVMEMEMEMAMAMAMVNGDCIPQQYAKPERPGLFLSIPSWRFQPIWAANSTIGESMRTTHNEKRYGEYNDALMHCR